MPDDFAGNFYPNPDNFPEVSFPQELIPPDSDPDEPDTILVEYSKAWTEVLMAACDQLGLYASWVGTHDDKITAVNRAQLLKWQLQNPTVCAERDYPTPYWDTETDVDDEAPTDTQDWYGEVTDPEVPAGELTFVENAVIWLFTGFVAIAATPAAALFFHTIAPRFVLAFNRGDVGEVWRVVVDAADYTEVDTGSLSAGDIVEIVVDGLDDLDAHDILLVKMS